jgi:hypothetical protein
MDPGDGSLAAVATVQPYEGPLYEQHLEACTAVEVSGVSLLQLDQRIEATSLPLVIETTL